MCLKEKQACILDFQVNGCVSLRFVPPVYLFGGQVGALAATAFWMCVCSSLFCFPFVFSAKAVLRNCLTFPLEESSALVPLCDASVLSDTVTQLVLLCQGPEVCEALCGFMCQWGRKPGGRITTWCFAHRNQPCKGNSRTASR